MIDINESKMDMCKSKVDIHDLRFISMNLRWIYVYKSKVDIHEYKIYIHES